MAVRENEVPLYVSGVDAVRYKMKALIIGTACVGIVGALYAHYMSTVQTLMPYKGTTKHEKIESSTLTLPPPEGEGEGGGLFYLRVKMPAFLKT